MAPSKRARIFMTECMSSAGVNAVDGGVNGDGSF